MRILLDENVPQPLVAALRAFVVAHDLAHVTELGWAGASDLDLYARAGANGFDVIVTNDEKQLQRAHEVRAIAASGLHRVQYAHKHSGLHGLGVAIGTVCAGLPLALHALENASSQRLIRLTGLDPTPKARLTIMDPATHWVKHWPTNSDLEVPAQATGNLDHLKEPDEQPHTDQTSRPAGHPAGG